MKAFFKKIFSRFSFVALSIILLFILNFALAAGVIILLYFVLSHYLPTVAEYVGYALTVLSWLVVVITVLHAANRDMVPETKIPWILCIVVLNMFGVAIYVTFSFRRPRKKLRKLFFSVEKNTEQHAGEPVSYEEAERGLGRWSQVSRALAAGDPNALLREGTRTEYLPSGEVFLERLLSDLENAKKYIFIETFILAKGQMWSAILDVLEKKVKEGVEVRVMYDDVGSMSRVRAGYFKELRKKGISCVKFTPFVPIISNVHNNRDHRKIVVIDGTVGYTGGINLADEYANIVKRFGYWKDSAVRMEGEGARNLALLFLRLYALQTKKEEDISAYFPERYEKQEGEGYVQPYGDGPFPLYGKHLGEDLYINILNTARRYVWISTPYLIIDYRMREALSLAAARGVDVRILTPHIPDKKLAFALTRSNYSALIKSGVKIYEYTPGFNHAKSFVADDEAAVVGTVNLDYRSFLFHFEDGVFMVGTKAVMELKKDMEECFSVSSCLTKEDAKKNVVWRGVCELAKIFAPLF